MATAFATNSIYRPVGLGSKLAPGFSNHDGDGPDRHRPHRPHGDHEGTDRVAVGVGVAVERLEHEDRSVKQDSQRQNDSGPCRPLHANDNVRSKMRVTECPRVLVTFFTDMNVLFGFHMPNYTHRGVPHDRLFDRVVEQAKAAEKAGFDLVTVMDHFYQSRGIGPETEPMLEAYTTLGALAASTSRVKLGTLVTGVTYRNPAILAKQATTLDGISGARPISGIGAAWNEDEHKGYGVDFPPIGRRMDRLDEALTIAKLMFTQDRPSFEGKYYKIDRALNVPRPIQPGGPKILIGGTGERRTLRLLAQHGDIGHWFGGDMEELNRKKQIFFEHCEAVKRDPAEVQLTLGAGLVLVEKEQDGKAILDRLSPERRAMATVTTVPQAAEMIGKWMDAGFTGFTFNNNIYSTDEAIARVGELIKIVNSVRATS